MEEQISHEFTQAIWFYPVSFLKLQTGDYLLLQTGDKLVLQDGVPPEPPASFAFAGAAYIARRRAALRRVGQIEAMLISFLTVQD